MKWSDYKVTFVSPNRIDVRTIRAVSQRDARWRAVRKFIMPIGAEITKVERISQ